jgi:16S rRNA (adenine1518-N6/adenine1519-N6)-dimethyltransferase
MHFMLQKEVVVRMAAAPGSGDYGRLTVMLAPHVKVERLFDIGAGAFKPPPQVTSTFFALTPHATPPFEIADPSAFAALVAAAFAKRRKTLRNAAGVDPGARAETLAPARFAALASQWIARRGDSPGVIPAE